VGTTSTSAPASVPPASVAAPSAAAPSEAATAPAAPEAWTQSDIFQGFDPMSVDLTGFTPGPNGEQSTEATALAEPTADCLAQVKGKKLAFLSGLAGNTWMAAIEKGVREQAAAYGIEVAATASTDFDPAKEASAVETVMASKPDILVTIPVDPTAGAQNYKPALDAGTTIAFYDNPVDGWTGGNEYVGIVTGDHYRMGKNAADLLAQAMGDEGTYGFISSMSRSTTATTGRRASSPRWPSSTPTSGTSPGPVSPATRPSAPPPTRCLPRTRISTGSTSPTAADRRPRSSPRSRTPTTRR
jgi:hypothetical protein